NNGFGLGYGNSNMNPLPGGHIDDTAIVPAFTPTGAHIEFYPLLRGIAFPEQPEALIAIHGIVPDGNYSGPVWTGVHLVPETYAEFRILQTLHGECQIGIRTALIGIRPQKSCSDKAGIAHFTGILEADEIHIVPIEGHIEDLPFK